MFAEDRGWTCIIERGGKAHLLGDFRHGPPIRLSLPRGRREGTLARDSPLGIGYCPIFFSPGSGGQQHMRASADRTGRAHIIRNDEEIEAGQCRAHFIGARQADRRICGHDPQRLDAAPRDGLEHRDGLEALVLGHARRPPEAAHAVDLGRRKPHMRGELIGEPADFAPAHRIRLPGQGKRPSAGNADAASCKMAIDDGIDLVGALPGLVDPLAIKSHDPFCFRPTIEKGRDVHARGAAFFGDGSKVWRDLARRGKRRFEALGMRSGKGVVDKPAVGQVDQ
jgi:hypothetical protein